MTAHRGLLPEKSGLGVHNHLLGRSKGKSEGRNAFDNHSCSGTALKTERGSMSIPGVIWEAGVPDEIAQGAKLRFVAAGDEGSSDEVIGWYVVLEYPDGTAKVLVKQVRYEPRLLKTWPGIASFVTQYTPEKSSVTVPIRPEVRNQRELWDLVISYGSK